MSDIVIGAGIVGLSCAYHLARRGRSVTLVEAGEAHPPASLGNAGGIAVTECVPAAAPGLWRKVPRWLLDPLGPLHLRARHAPRFLPWLTAFLAAGRMARVEAAARALADLNARVHPALAPMLSDLGMAGRLRRDGALTLYRDRRALAADALEWRLKRANGVRIEELGPDAVADLEPAVSRSVACGVYTPDWSTIADPAALVHALAARLREDGASVTPGEAVAVQPAPDGVAVRLADGRTVTGETATVAAGAWSAALARSAGDPVRLESERGYNLTLPDPGVTLRRHVSFGAERFVATPLAPGLRIGGAAEFAGLAATPDYRRSEGLAALARRYFPDLDTSGGTAWMGHRPATPDSLPVIGPSPRVPGLRYAFGHGHLGLTQAAPTGVLIADLVTGRTPEVDPAPFSIARFSRDAPVPTGAHAAPAR